MTKMFVSVCRALVILRWNSVLCDVIKVTLVNSF